MRVQIEVAPGELIDRITILEVKRDSISDSEKLQHVKNELETLNASATKVREHLEGNKLYKKLESLAYCTGELKVVNKMIWDVLQKQRDLENDKDLGEEFIEVSLQVYHANDRRAALKRKINELLDTDIAEVKEYK
jgi:hypothetical protein